MYDFGVDTIISLAYIKQSRVSLSEPWQNNLSNPVVYSEPCRTSELVFFKNKIFVLLNFSS